MSTIRKLFGTASAALIAAKLPPQRIDQDIGKSFAEIEWFVELWSYDHPSGLVNASVFCGLLSLEGSPRALINCSMTPSLKNLRGSFGCARPAREHVNLMFNVTEKS
jgi:hypothetical protein